MLKDLGVWIHDQSCFGTNVWTKIDFNWNEAFQIQRQITEDGRNKMGTWDMTYHKVPDNSNKSSKILFRDSSSVLPQSHAKETYS